MDGSLHCQRLCLRSCIDQSALWSLILSSPQRTKSQKVFSPISICNRLCGRWRIPQYSGSNVGLSTLFSLLPAPSMGWLLECEVQLHSKEEEVPIYRVVSKAFNGVSFPRGWLKNRIVFASVLEVGSPWSRPGPISLSSIGISYLSTWVSGSLEGSP